MTTAEEKAPLVIGEKLNEGKTKIIFDLPKSPNADHVLLRSKDKISAGDGARMHEIEGKSAISNDTTCTIFELLNACGVKTHFISKHDDTSFIAVKCDMIPLEVVSRRLATGSFLKRNPGVKEGYRFSPPKMETFFKDDANHDPQWSHEQIIEAELKFGGVTVGEREIELMTSTAIVVFEILEKAWATVDCTLVDMKVEFGVNARTGEILLADVVDNDAWRLWPSGDRRLMRDKQVYREMKVVTGEGLAVVKKNYKWVAEQCRNLLPGKRRGRVVIVMGSPSDVDHCRKIESCLKELGVFVELRVASAHKGTETALRILQHYEGHNIPTVFIAVAGRSNGLGPVFSGNTACPVINCPPVKADWGAQDIWSSMRLPSGLGCPTTISPEGAALAAAQALAMSDHIVWSRLRVKQLSNRISVLHADKKIATDTQ